MAVNSMRHSFLCNKNVSQTGSYKKNNGLLGFFCHLTFFKIHFFEKFFQEYRQSVKQFRSR